MRPRTAPYNRPPQHCGARWPRSKNLRTGSSDCCCATSNCSARPGLLQEQLAAVTQERDNLRSRLNAARHRIDGLLERLPREPDAHTDDAPPSETLRRTP